MEQISSQLNMGEFFAPGGPIGRAVNGYEYRQQQAEMALAVQKALSERYHLVAEAGTGVGKRCEECEKQERENGNKNRFLRSAMPRSE